MYINVYIKRPSIGRSAGYVHVRVLVPIAGAWLRVNSGKRSERVREKADHEPECACLGGISHESRKKRAKPFHNKGGSLGRIPSLPGSK